MNLRVLTYNIQFGRGLDRRTDLARTVACVQPFDADIIAFQETDLGRDRTRGIDQAAELADRLGMRHVFTPAKLYRDGVCGLATMTRLPITRHHHVPLPGQPHRWTHEPRSALISYVTWRGHEVRLINTHLSTSPYERPAQVTRLLEVLGPDDAIVVGDLNCSTRSKPQRALRERLRTAASPASWPSIAPVTNLDHILYRGPYQLVQAGVWRGPGHRHVSDHLPLFAEFTL